MGGLSVYMIIGILAPRKCDSIVSWFPPYFRCTISFWGWHTEIYWKRPNLHTPTQHEEWNAGTRNVRDKKSLKNGKGALDSTPCQSYDERDWSDHVFHLCQRRRQDNQGLLVVMTTQACLSPRRSKLACIQDDPSLLVVMTTMACWSL